MHLDQEKVQRFLHEELTGEERLEAQGHLEVCARCAISVERARSEEKEILALLGNLDHPAPRPELEKVLKAAGRTRSRLPRWAAGLLLALGVTSAAYAAPGSPLPGLFRRISERAESAPTTPTLPTPEVTARLSESGVTVFPGDGLTIRVASHQTRGHAVISLTEDREVVVRTEVGSPGFTSGLDDLLVLNQGLESDIEILVPLSAPRVQVLVGEEVVFSLVRGTVTAQAQPGEDGRYLIPLQEAGRQQAPGV